MTLEAQVQESAERIEQLEIQRRKIQWQIALEQRNFERLRLLERFESERSILAAKQAELVGAEQLLSITPDDPLAKPLLKQRVDELKAEIATNPNAEPLKKYLCNEAYCSQKAVYRVITHIGSDSYLSCAMHVPHFAAKANGFDATVEEWPKPIMASEV